MDKRGILLKNIIEIILACIAIGIVIYAANVLFQSYFGSQGDMQAKGALERVAQRLGEANETGTSSDMLLTAPAGWYIIAFDANHSENNGFTKDSLFKQNAVCVCQGSAINKKCKSEICRPIKMPLIQEGKQAFIEIKPSEIYFTNMNDYYSVTFKSADVINLSEEASLRAATNRPSNTPVDSWLKGKGSSLAGIGSCVNDVSKNTGISSELILAVAIHESDWGNKSMVPQCNNLFSIKSIEDECRIASVGTGIKSVPYKKYPNQCASVAHFGELISTLPKYQEAMRLKNDSEKMVYAIHGCSGPYAGQACLYSDDPEWATSVIAIMNQIKSEVQTG